ncbi:DNA-binding transcriptional LysR family regulator [Sphingomonas zeicaulis]|uniref:LysR family transcriptional regulator n=1 Tax=Sphingomonas zeicaulis TaxID=1632740 RepID=UPI003D256A93
MGAETVQGLATFIRVVEAGSFTAGARLLGTTPSAISKSIARLEKRLGVRLFQRTTRALALTEEGQAYHERMAPLIRAVEEAEDELRGDREARGRLRVTMPADLGRALMPAIAARFAPAHPALVLEMSLADRHVDLVREGYDLAIRAGAAADSGLWARPLGSLPLRLVASPAYLATHGMPADPAALHHHRHVRYLLGGRPYPIRFADGTRIDPEGSFDTDSGEALRLAAVGGIGIAHMLATAVAEDVAAGRLVVVLPDHALPAVPVQVLHAFARAMPLRARRFVEFVAGEMGVRR